jgi:polysaccharide export outer membrane protein
MSFHPFDSHSKGLLVLLLVFPLAAALAQTGTVPNPLATGSGVRPGDVIVVKVWREPDYSGEFQVDARGRVVLPLLGELVVSGRDAEKLSDSLTAAYRVYLKNPSIEIAVRKRIAVSGEVGKPGLYPVDATISVGDLISLAGGVTSAGNKKKIQLLRNGQVIVSGLGPGTVLQNSPVQSGDQVFVPQRSWMSRNGGVFLYAGVTVATSVLVAILVRR